jgi:hypothetical protein
MDSKFPDPPKDDGRPPVRWLIFNGPIDGEWAAEVQRLQERMMESLGVPPNFAGAHVRTK